MELEPGAQVTDRIVLERPLGAGAMAAVWQAHHAGLDAKVAVKFLFAHVSRRNPRLLKRFRAEASVAAKIRSPYVVQMLDYGVTDDERPFIVMEMLDGEPLDGLLSRAGPLSLAEVGTVVRHVGRALAKAHPLGVVHRDIKPGNLFNVGGRDLFVKVLDFGIAKQAVELGGQSITFAGEVTGTPRYMSPEQLADSKDVDERTDVWALAVVVYQLLSGRYPFAAELLADLYMEICGGVYAPISTLRPDVPAALDGWFARCLTVDRRHRMASAEEMMTAFSLASGLRSTVDDPAGASHSHVRPVGLGPGPRAPHDTAARVAPHETVAHETVAPFETMDLSAPDLAAPAPANTAPIEPIYNATAYTALTNSAPANPAPANPAPANPAPANPAPATPPPTSATLPPVTQRIDATHSPGPIGGPEVGSTAVSPTPPRRRGLGWAAAVLGITLGVVALVFAVRRDEPKTTADAPSARLAERAPTAAPPSAAPAPPAPAPSIEPSITPSAALPSASAAAPPLPRTLPPRPPPPTTPPPPPKPKCIGDDAYIVDANGHLIPKPGCM